VPARPQSGAEAPHGSPCREGCAVEANVTPHQAILPNRDAVRLRIAVVSGVRFLREGLAEILERDPLVSVVRLCANLSEAVALSPALQADVLLLDATVPDGAAAVRRALDIAPGMRIVAFAVRETEEDIIPWAEAGVIGYIPSTAALADLARLVLEIHSGEQVCSGRVAAGLLRRIALTASPGNGHNAPFAVPALTKRERQAAELIRTGLSDKEIARRLNISLATTKSHVHNLLSKLNARRRSEVATHLREYGQHPR
jgi:two-component system, NarL family, nitrate/nitrite response regulator NarL